MIINKRTLNIIIAISASALLLLGIVITVLFTSRDNGDVKRATIEDVIEMINASEPTKYQMNLEYTLGSHTLSGRYVLRTSEKDGERIAELSYDRDKFTTFEAGKEPPLLPTVQESNLLYAKGEKEIYALIGGKLSPLENDIIFAKKGNISKSSFESCTFKEEDGMLILEGVPRADLFSENVSNAKMIFECDKKSGEIKFVSLTYTDKEGGTVSTETTCFYGKESFEIPTE